MHYFVENIHDSVLAAFIQCIELDNRMLLAVTLVLVFVQGSEHFPGFHVVTVYDYILAPRPDTAFLINKYGTVIVLLLIEIMIQIIFFIGGLEYRIIYLRALYLYPAYNAFILKIQLAELIEHFRSPGILAQVNDYRCLITVVLFFDRRQPLRPVCRAVRHIYINSKITQTQ